jgi:putative ABC transport system substrate-binding protein
MMRRLLAALILLGALATICGRPSDSAAQERLPLVGLLDFGGGLARQQWGPFHRVLQDQGWIEGKTVAFAYAHAGSEPSRYAEAVAELVRRKVDVVFADSAPAVRAAFAATRTIPIVGQDYTTDPVAEGYAESYGRPGRNLTGVFLDAPEFSGKWLELLKTVIPGLSRVVALWDPSPGGAHLHALQAAGRSLGLRLQVVEVRKPEDIDRAGAAFRGRPQAIIMLPSPMMYVEGARCAKLAAKERPTRRRWPARLPKPVV